MHRIIASTLLLMLAAAAAISLPIPALALDAPPDLTGKWKEVQSWWRTDEHGAAHSEGGPGMLEIVEQKGRTVYGRTTWKDDGGLVHSVEFTGVISAGNDKIYAVEHDCGFKFMELKDGKIYQYYLESRAAGGKETSAWFTEFERME